jgi:glycolate oxidase iron-sulfur subunit
MNSQAHTPTGEISKESLEYNCAKCGACVPVCPVFRAEGREALTARGRMHLLMNSLGQPPSALLADVFARCLLCGACEQVCPRHLPITRLIAEARSRFPLLLGPASLQKAVSCAVLSRPTLLEGLMKAGFILNQVLALPKKSGLRLKLALKEECPVPVLQPLPESEPQAQPAAGLAYFVGCFAQHIQPSIATATERLLRRCNLNAEVPAAQCCCGLAAWSSGKLEQARDLARRNIAAFAGTERPIITSCASCSTHLLAYPTLFAEHDPWHEQARLFASRVQEFAAFFNQYLPIRTNLSRRIFWHDPCHLRFQEDGMKNPRLLLGKMGFVLLEPEDGPRCCGQGGLFHRACPETAAKIFRRSCEQARAGQPDCIISTCSGCLMQYQQGLAGQGGKIRVAHLAVLLEEALGGEKCA